MIDALSASSSPSGVSHLAADPEVAHEKALAFLGWLGRQPRLCEIVTKWCTVNDKRLTQTVMGIPFSAPLGLAAGFDKNGVALIGLAALGFSHIEMGTVTPLEQKGNTRPRMFRYPGDEALINRMGFNNEGAGAVRYRLESQSKIRSPVPIGVSLGKGKDTLLEVAAEDYIAVLEALYDHGQYFAVNVSSPNTPGLRVLQDKQQLSNLLEALQYTLGADGGGESNRPKKPLVVKIAPDLEWAAIDDLVEVCLEHGISGLIATNTTISRHGLRVTPNEAGGMSGRPLFPRSLEVVRYLRQHLPAGFPIIGVGGIMTAEDAYTMLKAGATVLQTYSGFVYGGPFFARDIHRGLLALMERDGVTHVSHLHTTG